MNLSFGTNMVIKGPCKHIYTETAIGTIMAGQELSKNGIDDTLTIEFEPNSHDAKYVHSVKGEDVNKKLMWMENRSIDEAKENVLLAYNRFQKEFIEKHGEKNLPKDETKTPIDFKINPINPQRQLYHFAPFRAVR